MTTYFDFTPSSQISIVWEGSGLFIKLGKFERWLGFSIGNPFHR